MIRRKFLLCAGAISLFMVGCSQAPALSPAPPTTAPAVFATQFAPPLSGVPLPVDAIITVEEAHRFGYTTQASITEIAEFYTNAMPGMGWEVKPGSAFYLADQLYQAEFESEGASVFIAAQLYDGIVGVTVADVAALSPATPVP